MFLHTWHPQPLIAAIGSFSFRWYGLLLAIAALVGFGLIQRIGRRYRLDVNRLFDLALITLVAGFIGARIYHVLNEWTYYWARPTEMWKVWNGGLALHGGLIFGAVALFIMARRWRWNAWLIADIMAPAVALGQAIGRWGNYANQELFGKPTSLPWGIPIDPLNRPPAYVTQTYFHPTFLYESLGLLVIAVLLWLMHRRRWRMSDSKQPQPYGAIALTYFVLYSVLRISTESLRLDRTPIIGGVRLPILVSGLIIILALIIMIIIYRRIRTQRP